MTEKKSRMEEYRCYIARNRDVEYKVSLETLPAVAATHKWVGAQYVSGCLYGIPNDMGAVLKYTQSMKIYLGDVGTGLFKWTGGCVWNHFLYGFPRTSNKLLKMSLDSGEIQYIHLDERYPKEHHYGGVCTRDGIIYQPPRDSDHILVWDLKTEKARRIYLNTKSEKEKFRYCGSILHPNGFVYFLPEMGERIIKLDTRTEEWDFIDPQIEAMVFDAKIAADGCIYGYSAYCPGILKINAETDCTEMIHQEISPGAYGTKMGVNGHLYSIPGDGNFVWDYDPFEDLLKSIYEFPDSFRAKFAGGASTKDGNIFAVPARENRILKLEARGCVLKMPDDIYSNFFQDCY